MTDEFEVRLDRLFADYASLGVRPVDRLAIARATVAAARVRPAVRWRGQRSGWPWRLVLAAVLTLALVGVGVALVANALNQRVPVLPTATTSPTTPGVETVAPTRAAAQSAAPWESRGYAAIVIRPVAGAEATSVNVVAVLPDGREHLIRRIDPADVGGMLPAASGTVSENGWLAVYVGGNPPHPFHVALLNLLDPGQAPLVVDMGAGPSLAWSPDGLFAYPGSVQLKIWTMLVTDPRTRTTQSLPGLQIPGGGPTTVWAADGSGLLVSIDSPHAYTPAFGIAPIDGGPVVPGTPRLAWRGSRSIAEGGYLLDWSAGTGLVVFDPKGGPAITWYLDQLAPATLVGESFSSEGRAIWLLLEQGNDADRTVILARQTAPGLTDIVATIPIDDSTTRPTGFVLSPDDSMFVFSTSKGWELAGVGRSGAANLDGSPAGFMAGPEISAWFGTP